ncbi:hypothetical protein P692DRAFT_201806189 [Suillus brevipes Sb2]|nr:hypothetical protein P692DRAFT_201806189 [Suillus brevipes Sb2]
MEMLLFLRVNNFVILLSHLVNVQIKDQERFCTITSFHTITSSYYQEALKVREFSTQILPHNGGAHGIIVVYNLNQEQFRTIMSSYYRGAHSSITKNGMSHPMDCMTNHGQIMMSQAGILTKHDES